MSANPESYKALRILIVEDEALIADEIHERLNRLGFEVVGVCYTGEQAIQSAEELCPDLALMDIRLKGKMDGIEAGGHIYEQFQIPVIYLTAHSDRATFERAKATAPFGYILKPFQERDLLVGIEMAVYRHAQDQLLRDRSRNGDAHLQILTEQMPTMLWTTDSHLRITTHRGAGFLGANLQPNELVGQTLFEYFRADDEDHEAIRPHRLALQGESVSYEIDWMDRIFRARVSPLRGSGGHIVGTVGTALDITRANEVEGEFRAARRIQEEMLPKEVPALPGFDLASVCHPAEATGGDYYDYIPMPDGSLGIVVADVSRHGFASALIMAASKRVIRTLLERGILVGEVLSIANHAIAEDTNFEYFVTLFYARLDPKTRRLTYAGAGHEAYIIDPTEPPRKLASTALPLGVANLDIDTCDEPVTLAPGQMLLLFTDGYSEARASAGGLFGIPRVLEIVLAHRSKSTAEIIAALDDAVRDFCHPGVPNDDLTIVLLKVDAEG